MINAKIYPREDGDIQYGVRRIPLHYLPEHKGGNGQLQHELLELCQLTIFYHNCKHEYTDEEIETFQNKFESNKTSLLDNQERIYENLLDVARLSESKFKEQIKFDLTTYYFELVDFINGVKL